MTGLILATLETLAALSQAEGGTTPDRAEVQAAYLEFLTGGCDSEEAAGCHHPPFAEIRRVSCAPQASNRARCRFEQRTFHIFDRRPRWRRAEHGFVYDTARGRWAMDCRIEATENAAIQTIRCN